LHKNAFGKNRDLATVRKKKSFAGFAKLKKEKDHSAICAQLI
jgi:hypothetical protein